MILLGIVPLSGRTVLSTLESDNGLSDAKKCGIQRLLSLYLKVVECAGRDQEATLLRVSGWEQRGL